MLLSHLWLASIDWAFWAMWLVTGTLLTTGFLGSFVPLVPGPLIIFIGCALHSWLRPISGMGWGGMLLELLLLVAAYVTDFAAGAVGSKKFGGSRWGFAGVVLGGIVGLFFSLPGLILGPLIGSLVFEIAFAEKSIRPALKATAGSALGIGLGLIARGLIGALMVGLFFACALWLSKS